MLGLLISGDLPPGGGGRQERERWMNGALFEATERRSWSCLEGSSFDRWEWALIVMEGIESGAAMDRAEPNELPMLPTALLPLESTPGLRLEVDMDILLPLLLKVPTSLPSPSDRPGKLKSSSMTSKAAPGFITRVISSKRSSHLSSGTPRAIRLTCTKSNESFANGRPSRKLRWTQLILLTRSLSLQRRGRLGWRDTISRPTTSQPFQYLAASITHTPFPQPISSILLRGPCWGGSFQDWGNECHVNEPPVIWRVRRVSMASRSMTFR